jgi:hypothetical protein
MTDGTQEKQVLINQLRDGFMAFVEMLLKMPGSPLQKQQAFLRFDEGNMWMQNAIMSFVAPVEPPTAIVNPQAAQPVDPIPNVQA